MATERRVTRRMSWDSNGQPAHARNAALHQHISSSLAIPPPAKPSRLLPNTPLHMTTRRVASKAATVSSAGSVASIGNPATRSRRNSAENTTRSACGQDIDAHRPTKKARLSDPSSSSTSTSTINTAAEDAARHGKRQTATPDVEVDDSNQDRNIPDIIATTPDEHRRDEPQGAGGQQPTAQKPALEARRDADESDVQPFLSPAPKRRGRKPKVPRANTTPNASGAESFLPGTPRAGDHGDMDNGTDQDAPKAARKLPGRKRAPHADPIMEAALRRQLQLRVGHRALSKALKPVLIELAKRTAKHLSNRAAELDEQFREAEKRLQAELTAHRDARLRILANEVRLQKEFYNGRFQADKEYRWMLFNNRIQSALDDYDARLEHRILELSRQYEHEVDEDATDDEDGNLVHPLHCRPTKQNPLGILDSKFDSRSRFYLAVESISERNWIRAGAKKLQEAAVEKTNMEAEDDIDAIHLDADELPKSFGTIDQDRREKAIIAWNISTICMAVKHVEEEAERKLRPPTPTPPALPNEEAFGLLALANAINLDRSDQPPEGVLLGQEPSQHAVSAPVVKQENLPSIADLQAYPEYPDQRSTTAESEISRLSRQAQTQLMPEALSFSVPASPRNVQPGEVAQDRQTPSAGANGFPLVGGQDHHGDASDSSPWIQQRKSRSYDNRASLSRIIEDSPGTKSTLLSEQRTLAPLPLPPPSTSERPFWRNILSQDTVCESRPQAYEDSLRRRSEASIFPSAEQRDTSLHFRKSSAPANASAESFHSSPRQSHPNSLSGAPGQHHVASLSGPLPPPPPTMANSYQQPHPNSLPPPHLHPNQHLPPPGYVMGYPGYPHQVTQAGPPPHVSAPLGPPLHFPAAQPLPSHVTTLQSAQGPPAAQLLHQQAPQQQPGVFFGPPPPPQFGPQNGGGAWHRP